MTKDKTIPMNNRVITSMKAKMRFNSLKSRHKAMTRITVSNNTCHKDKMSFINQTKNNLSRISAIKHDLTYKTQILNPIISRYFTD